MIDSNLILRNTDPTPDIESSETGAAFVDFGGPDLEPMTYMVVVTGTSGTSPTLDVKIIESDNNDAEGNSVAFEQITAAGVYYATAKFNGGYRRYSATLGGSSPVFENVLIAPVPAGRYTHY